MLSDEGGRGEQQAAPITNLAHDEAGALRRAEPDGEIEAFSNVQSAEILLKRQSN